RSPPPRCSRCSPTGGTIDRKSTRLNSSHVSISYAVFCLKKKKKRRNGLRWQNGGELRKSNVDLATRRRRRQKQMQRLPLRQETPPALRHRKLDALRHHEV